MDPDALFPAGPHRFHLALGRGEPRDFFAPRDPTDGTLRERGRWLDAGDGRYAGAGVGADGLIAELHGRCRDWGLVDPAATGENAESLDGAARMAALGRRVEPDLLLLAKGPDGVFRLAAGALCFPTGWALTEKLGQPLESIHGVVPGLNSELGAKIAQFLTRLRPGPAYLRDNWGISAHADLNQHPVRALAPPDIPVVLDRLWLRVEHQALVALPETGGILFGIRIANHRLDRIDGAVRAGLARALRAMPDSLAAYKRLDRIRSDLTRLLT